MKIIITSLFAIGILSSCGDAFTQEASSFSSYLKLGEFHSGEAKIDQYTVNYTFEDISLQSGREILSAITEVAASIKPLQVPNDKYFDTINVTTSKKDVWAGYMDGVIEASFPEMLDICHGPEDFSPVGTILHEYGHAVFEANFTSAYPWQFSFFGAKERGKQKVKYTELFADVIAVVSLNDPEAIRTSICDIDRSFSVKRDVEDWNDARNHNQLSPVRSYIGEKYLGKISKGKLINAVFNAIIITMDEDEGKGYKMTVQERNTLLIHNLDELLQ